MPLNGPAVISRRPGPRPSTWSGPSTACCAALPQDEGRPKSPSRASEAAIAEEDAENCRRHRRARRGPDRGDQPRARTAEPVNVLTHCNAGWLAFVDHGSATAPIYAAHDRGIPVHVWVDETRPRNQGARLTAWELGKHGVPHTVISRQCRRPPHAARPGRPGHRRHRPHHLHRRRGQQDRHLSQGPGCQGQRRPLLRRPALLHL